MTGLLGYVPFLDPMNVESWWYLTLIPLALGVAVAYKGVRVKDFNGYWKQVLVMTAQIVLLIVALGVGLYLVVTQLMPRIAVV